MVLLDTYVRGMTWGWTGIRGTWDTPAAAVSMRAMVDTTAVNWVAITFAALQANAQATEIPYWAEPTVTDDEVVAEIRRAQSLGLQVILKPVVNCADGTWRAHINFFDIDVPPEPKWSQWFAAYSDFICHYAQVAQQTGCAMLCLGCEMVQTDRREAEWRALVAKVRGIYTGLLTYNCDKYQEDHVGWWDAVDIISSSGYYPVDDWEAQLDRISAVVVREGKPFFFMEAGCPSREGSQYIPNDWSRDAPPDLDAQRAWYDAAFAATEKLDWVRGFVLWDWPPQLPAGLPAEDSGYCMYGKPAGDVIREHYTRMAAENR